MCETRRGKNEQLPGGQRRYHHRGPTRVSSPMAPPRHELINLLGVMNAVCRPGASPDGRT